MRILLTNNEATELECCDLGLGYLAAGLIQKGHEVQLLLSHMKEEKFRQKMMEFKPDVIGIKVLSSGVQRTIRTIELVRSTRECIVVIGGPHVTGDPHRILDYVPADYAFQGEADHSFPRLISLLEEGRAPQEMDSIGGMVYRRNGTVVVTPLEGVNHPDGVNNLDELPFPAWELMPPSQYQSLACKNPPAASVMITRGCTNHCTFCAESGKRLRHRSVENVVAEMKYLVERFRVREIQFLDSNFLFSKRYVIRLCESILKSALDLVFCAPNGMRLEALDEEVCQWLARIGFYRANIGIESGSKEILKLVNKRTSPDLFHEKVITLRRHGIYVIGNFMLGFPGETREQMEQTLNLALSLDLTGANFAIYTPLPGTPIFETLVEEGKLERSREFHNYNFVAYENSLSTLSPKALRRFRNRCMLRFFLRWRIIKPLLGLLRNRHLRRSLSRRIYGMYIQKFLTS